MCLAVYIASSIELQPSSWSEAAPSFYLEPVQATDPVCKKFSLAHVYYAGSHEGCGCGFFKEGREEDEDFNLRLDNYARLGRCVRETLANGGRCQIFACWEGEQSLPQESTAVLSLTQVEAIEFELTQQQLVNVEQEA
jgi:hypothetical protein